MFLLLKNTNSLIDLENNIKRMIKYYLKYLKSYKYKLVLLFLLITSSSISALATPYFLKIIIDDIFPSGQYKDLINILLVLLSIYIFRILVSFWSNILYTRISRSIVADIRIDIFGGVLKKDFNFFKENKTGELIFLITNDVENIQDAITSLVLDVVNNAITVIGILVMLLVLDVELAIIGLIVIPIMVLIAKLYTKRIRKSFEEIQILDGNIYNFFLERLQNIRVLKIYRTIALEINNAKDLHKKLINSYIKNAATRAYSSNLTTFFMAIGPLLVIMYGGKQVFAGAISLGSLIAFIQYLNKLYSPTLGLISSYNDFIKAKVSMKRVYNHLSVLTTPGKLNNIQTSPLLEIDTITLKNVGIKYGDETILNNINATFKKGEIYAIIGESGSGKSSLVNVLCGFNKPSWGQILINGNEEDIAVERQKSIALIEKENQIFSKTILYNVKYGLNKSNVKLADALSQSLLDEVIEILPSGIETEINSSGTTLSDGQKQRISIARALLNNPSVLIIDEATSSLDSKKESLILQNIRENYKDTIVIYITHRLNSLENCDVIYEIKGKALNKVEIPTY